MGLLPVLLVGCAPTIDPDDLPTPAQKIPAIYGHGGMGIEYYYPIDSWESIGRCLENGADGTEMDVQMSKDGVLVAYHHHTLDENTNCGGAINDYDWEGLIRCEYKVALAPNTPLMRVSDILDRIPDLHRFVFTFDCKLYDTGPTIGMYDSYDSDFARAIDTLARKYNIQDQLFVESSSPSFLRLLKHYNPNIKLFIYPADFETGFSIATEDSLYGITLPYTSITREQTQQAHDAGLRITVFGATSAKKNIEALKRNPDHIQTDAIKDMLRFFGKKE